MLTSNSAMSKDYELLNTDILKVRFHTVLHPYSTIRNHTTIHVNGLQSGCTALYITPTDKEALTAILAAKVASKKVTLYYSDTTRAPWTSEPTLTEYYCAMTGVEINN